MCSEPGLPLPSASCNESSGKESRRASKLGVAEAEEILKIPATEREKTRAFQDGMMNEAEGPEEAVVKKVVKKCYGVVSGDQSRTSR